MDKWIIAIGKHGGRVSGKKWVAVQNIMEENIPTGKKPAKMHNDYSLLSGLIWCGKCGSRMFAKRRSYKSGDTVLYDYVCQSKLRGGTGLCDCKNLGGQQADDLVCRHLTRFLREGSGMDQLLENMKNGLRAQEREDPVRAIEARMKKCGDEMDNLVRTVAAGNLGTAFVRRVNVRINELDAELAGLSRERDQLRREAERMADREPRVDTLAALLSGLKDSFGILSIHEKRTLIRLLVKKIVWDGEDLHIFIDGG